GKVYREFAAGVLQDFEHSAVQIQLLPGPVDLLPGDIKRIVLLRFRHANTASQYPRDIEGGGEYGRPLLNIVFEVRAGDSQQPPGNVSAASVLRSRDPILGRIDDVPRLLPAEETHDVLQRGLHAARPRSRDR